MGDARRVMQITPSRRSDTSKCSILVLLVVSISCLAQTEVTVPAHLFIRARCDGKLSSIVPSALEDAARASGKYDLISSLDDNGRFDKVQTIYMTCAENNDVTAVAT